MNSSPILVYGAGGFGREVAWLLEDCQKAGQPLEVVGFIDDNLHINDAVINGLPVLSLDGAVARFPSAAVAIGVGTPRTRQIMVEKAQQAGFLCRSIVHPRVEMSRWVDIGDGTLICAGNILTTNIKLGKHVQINLGCTIGHDVVMGDYTTLAPGVHVSGWVHFGARVYVGTGAVFVNGTEDKPIYIGDDAIIGAGSCVTKSVRSGVVVVGIPAREIRSIQE